MISAFGVEHGEISKGFNPLAASRQAQKMRGIHAATGGMQKAPRFGAKRKAAFGQGQQAVKRVEQREALNRRIKADGDPFA